MAEEEIQITNVGGDGNIASEQTLQKLVEACERMSRSQGGGGGAKAQAMYAAATTSSVAATKVNTKTKKTNTDAVDKNTKSFKALGLAGGALKTLFGQLLGSALGFGKELLMGGDQVSDFAKHIPLIGSYLGPLSGFIDNTVSSFRDLSAVGAGFSGGINQMLQTSVDLELNLSEMSSLVGQNAASLRLLGGTVEGGVARFAAINKNMKATGDFAALKQMGFTIEEVNEGIADYTALQANMGRVQNLSNTQLAAGSAEYLSQMDRLAKATGKSRKELEAQAQARAQDASFRALANQFEAGSEAANNFQESMGFIDTLPAEVAAGLKDLADGVPQTEEGIAALNALGPGVMDAMNQIAQGADVSILQDALAAGAERMDAQFGTTGQGTAAFFTALGDSSPALKAFLDSSNLLKNAADANLDAAADEQAARQTAEDTLLEFDDKVKSARAAIQQALLDSGVFQSLADSFSGMADIFNDPDFKEGIAAGAEMLAGAIRTTLDEVKAFGQAFREGGFEKAWEHLTREGGPLDGALSSLGSAISDGLGAALTSPSVLAALAALFGGKMLMGAVAGAATRGIESRLGSIFGGGGAGGQGGMMQAAARSGPGAGMASAAGGASRGGGNIGRSLQGMGGGLLKGIATGLRAFANPQVAIGAGVVAGVILVIGGAIAGASWLLGQALPTLVDGIKSFETMDGSALSAAAQGMLSVSGAMAAFGAGTAVSGLGTLVGGITEGIGRLFGAEDPLEKVKRFGEMNINRQGVTNNANAINAMTSSLSSFTTDGLDTDGVISYTRAIEDLAEALETLNEQLAKDNDTLFGGDRASAGELLNGISVSSTGSAAGIEQLNSTMQAMLVALNNIEDSNVKIDRNTQAITSGNLAGGYVSRT